jgi:poly-gamma-glutamate synthesis protein (capsule biosynthesis protein)
MSPGAAAAARVGVKERMESLLTESRYQDGRLVEVRIHPVDLGQDGTRPLSRLGVPFMPLPAMAQRTLEKLQRLSTPFGTNITIENGVGVIRIPAGQAVPSAVTAREAK